MFHIKSLELVHWDYWQRIKNIPLDAKIITIAGQNGSGKTTLLDALRTLFGLDCSMGRTYKHYARHSGQQTAWIRAVVDNKTVGRQLSNRPFRSSGFFSDDEVTLFCQIQKNGGDWKRQYLMRPGNIQIEDVTEATDWLGVENYRKRLANAGLSPAMAKVLALEQGETDKLCEYAPRQLLDLVFQVFGDKEVLDAYDEAKRHQKDTETELKRFETELEASRTNLEGLRLRVANYHQWEDLHKERRNLLEEVLPSLEYHEAREKAGAVSRQLRDARRPMAVADSQLTDKRNAVANQARHHSDAQEQETLLEREATALGSRLAQINGKLKPLDSLLEQKERLQKLSAESGADIAEVSSMLAKQDAELSRQKQARLAIATRIAADQATISALQGKSAMPEPEPVRAMRRALREAGIGHAMLSDIVEVTDPKWQGAVEGVLGGYASVVLLEKAKDAPAAYRLAERERYRHFIVPDCVTAPVKKDDSLLSVVRFSAATPSWLIDQLQRIERVESVDAGFKSGNEEWITPDAYHRERRGGRSLFVEASRYRFGDAGRTGRLEALQRALPKLEAEEDALTLTISKLAAEVGLLKARIAGVDAAKELAARQEEFDEAATSSVPLKAERLAVGSRLGELQGLTKAATVARTRADTSWQNARMALAEAEAGLRLGYKRQIEQRHEHARRPGRLAARLAPSAAGVETPGPARRAGVGTPEQPPGGLARHLAAAQPRARGLGTGRHRHRPAPAPVRPAARPPERNGRAPLPEQPRHRSHRQCARGLHGPAALHHQNLQQEHQGAGRTGRHRRPRRPGAPGKRRRPAVASGPARALQVRRQGPDRHERRRSLGRPAGHEVAGAVDRLVEIGRRLGRFRVHRRTVRPPGHPQHPAGRRVPEEHRGAVPDDDAADAQHRRLRSVGADAHHQ